MKKLEKILRKLIIKLLGVFMKTKRLSVSDIDINSINRILIVRQHNEIGDMLLATPLFSAIRKKFPNSFISLIARPRNIDVVMNNPDINEIILFDVKKYRKSPWMLLKLLFDIRKKKFDLSIVPCTVSFSLTSAILSFLSGAKYRIGTDGKFFGFYDESSFFFNIYVPAECKKHQVDINLDFIKILGIDGIDRRNKMRLLNEEEEYAKKLLTKIARIGDSPLSPLIGVHPGGGKVQNRWQPSCFGKLIENILGDCPRIGYPTKLGAVPIKVLLMYGPGEDRIIREVLNNTQKMPIVVPLINLRMLAAIIKNCKLFICNDTGVLHIAAGVGTPTIAIFGPSNPDYWNPVGEEHVSVRGKDNTTGSVSLEDVFLQFKEIFGRI